MYVELTRVAPSEECVPEIPIIGSFAVCDHSVIAKQQKNRDKMIRFMIKYNGYYFTL
jgi:hypothetical protein